MLSAALFFGIELEYRELRFHELNHVVGEQLFSIKVVHGLGEEALDLARVQIDRHCSVNPCRF